MKAGSCGTARLVLAAVCAAWLLAQPAWAAPTTIQVRVEGLTETLFEGAVTTDGKTIRMDGVDRICDGTNNGANPSAGPTMTSGLDDAKAVGGPNWHGSWDGGFEDFLIDEIGPHANVNNTSLVWGIALNWHATEVGGCQARVLSGDEALFGYGLLAKQHLLKLKAPRSAATGESFQVQVVDGADGDTPVAGASVGGQVTDGNGQATFTLNSPGNERLKAEKEADSLRSNAAVICIYAPGSGQCGSGIGQPSAPDSQGPLTGPGSGPEGGYPETAGSSGPFERKPPRARIVRPRDRTRYRRGPARIEGTVEESGSGVDQIYVRLTRSRRGRCTWYSAREERFVGRSCRRAEYSRVGRGSPDLGTGVVWSLRFRRPLPAGAYVAQVRVRDQAGNADSAIAKGRTRVRFRVLHRRGR